MSGTLPKHKINQYSVLFVTKQVKKSSKEIVTILIVSSGEPLLRCVKQFGRRHRVDVVIVRLEDTDISIALFQVVQEVQYVPFTINSKVVELPFQPLV